MVVLRLKLTVVIFKSKETIIQNLKSNNMNYFLGILGPIGVLSIISSYLLITIPSLILILKNEKGLGMFLWLLLILFLPFLGGGIYLLKYFLNRKPKLKNA